MEPRGLLCIKTKKMLLILLLLVVLLLSLLRSTICLFYLEGEEGRESFPLQFPESRRWCSLCCPLLGGPANTEIQNSEYNIEMLRDEEFLCTEINWLFEGNPRTPRRSIVLESGDHFAYYFYYWMTVGRAGPVRTDNWVVLSAGLCFVSQQGLELYK